MADYNINAVTRRVVFTGSAGTGPYAFSFEILNNTDIAIATNEPGSIPSPLSATIMSFAGI